MTNDQLLRLVVALLVTALFFSFWINYLEIKEQEKKDDVEGEQK